MRRSPEVTYEFEVKKEITLDATPEQVWEAIATGPGINSWFMGRTEVEPGEGGTVRLDFGDGAMESTITAWDPPNRLAYQGGSRETGQFVAFEYLVEGRAGGSTVVRFVQSGLGDNWEAEYDALNEGDAMYLHKMAQYVLYFRGRRAAAEVFLNRSGIADRQRFWSGLTHALGLGETVAVGDKARTNVDGLAPVEGVVDYLSDTILGLRTDDGLYRFLCAPGDTVFLGHHIYSDDADQNAIDQGWQAWLEKAFA
jgi:uncharacterized protein YndB with AHSA1/START domain